MEEIKLYKGKVKIYFSERDWMGKKIHEFKNDKGEKLISVTSVSGLLDKSKFLVPWAVKLMGIYLLERESGKPVNEIMIETAKRKWREAKEEAADLGTQIHDWIEQKIKGLEPAMPEDERVKNGAMAYLKWMKSHNIKIKESERIIYSKKYNYAGRCDWYGIDKDDDVWVIGDHKSSKRIYNEMRYQLAGYWSALEEELKKKFKRGYLVKLGKEDASFEVLEISRKEYLEDIKAFLGLLDTKRREDELK